MRMLLTLAHPQGQIPNTIKLKEKRLEQTEINVGVILNNITSTNQMKQTRAMAQVILANSSNFLVASRIKPATNAPASPVNTITAPQIPVYS